MVRVGLVGVGFMGWIHYLAYQKCREAELVAFCSRDARKRAGDWRGIQGNFGPPGERIDVSHLSAHSTLDPLLADDSIDLIDICLPPHLHRDAISRALAAGKHVLCEKPLVLSADEGAPLMTQAAGKSGDGTRAVGGRLLVAHILPFYPEYRLLLDAVADQRFGKLLGGRFKRVIGPPDWIPDFYDRMRVGGPLIDLHVHDAHLIRMLFGMPNSTHSARRMVGDCPKYVETIFHFDDPALVVSAVSGVIDQPSRGFTHGYDVQFERANVQFEMAAFGDGQSSAIPLTIAHADGTLERPETQAADPISLFAEELDAAARAVRTGDLHPALDGQIALDAIRICEMQSG